MNEDMAATWQPYDAESQDSYGAGATDDELPDKKPASMAQWAFAGLIVGCRGAHGRHVEGERVATVNSHPKPSVGRHHGGVAILAKTERWSLCGGDRAMLLPHDSTPYLASYADTADFLPGQANNYYERSIAMPYGRQLRGLGITDVQKTDTMKQNRSGQCGGRAHCDQRTAGRTWSSADRFTRLLARSLRSTGPARSFGVAIYAAHAKG